MNRKKIINIFKKSKHYDIIIHLIDIVNDDEIIVDVMKKLGYKTSLSFNNTNKKDIIVNHRYIFLPLSNKISIINASRCVIFEIKQIIKEWKEKN